MSDNPAKIYGIDLGTTYSCIACVDEYVKPVVLKNQEGDNTTPSVVQFDSDQRIVGKVAKEVAQLYPDSVVALVKRQMGTDWRYSFEGKSYSPEEISSYILRKLTQDVKELTGESVKEVVITCPAYFGEAERKATQLAGELADLNVRAILNEPTAAAFAYGLGQEQEMRVLVYDLGGGTFDVTLIDITSDAIDVVATGGNHKLGGFDWDGEIVKYLAEQWQSGTASSDDPLDSDETRSKLFLDAENVKRQLTGREKVEIGVQHAGRLEKASLTREKFEELTRSKLEETIEHTRLVLKEAMAKLQSEDKPTDVMFHKLLLVGGSTRMKQVARRLKEEFPQIEPQLFDPDESVAKGAALYGQKLIIGDQLKKTLESKGFKKGVAVPEKVKREAINEVALELGLPGPAVERIEKRQPSTVTSCSYGMEARHLKLNRMVVFNLITKNEKLPTNKKSKFGTLEPDQTYVNLKVMENRVMGEFAEVDDCKYIGEAQLPLPPGLPVNAPIEVTFNLGVDGLLQLTGFDPAAKRTIKAEFHITGLMTEEETQEARERSTSLAIS